MTSFRLTVRSLKWGVKDALMWSRDGSIPRFANKFASQDYVVLALHLYSGDKNLRSTFTRFSQIRMQVSDDAYNAPDLTHFNHHDNAPMFYPTHEIGMPAHVAEIIGDKISASAQVWTLPALLRSAPRLTFSAAFSPCLA